MKYFTYKKSSSLKPKTEKSLENILYADLMKDRNFTNSKVTKLNTLPSNKDQMEDLISTNIELNAEQEDFIKDCLSNHFIFRDLSEEIM